MDLAAAFEFDYLEPNVQNIVRYNEYNKGGVYYDCNELFTGS